MLTIDQASGITKGFNALLQNTAYLRYDMHEFQPIASYTARLEAACQLAHYIGQRLSNFDVQTSHFTINKPYPNPDGTQLDVTAGLVLTGDETVPVAKIGIIHKGYAYELRVSGKSPVIPDTYQGDMQADEVVNAVLAAIPYEPKFALRYLLRVENDSPDTLGTIIDTVRYLKKTRQGEALREWIDAVRLSVAGYSTLYHALVDRVVYMIYDLTQKTCDVERIKAMPIYTHVLDSDMSAMMNVHNVINQLGEPREEQIVAQQISLLFNARRQQICGMLMQNVIRTALTTEKKSPEDILHDLLVKMTTPVPERLK